VIFTVLYGLVLTPRCLLLVLRASCIIIRLLLVCYFTGHSVEQWSSTRGSHAVRRIILCGPKIYFQLIFFKLLDHCSRVLIYFLPR
jgi:hypothetical protein